MRPLAALLALVALSACDKKLDLPKLPDLSKVALPHGSDGKAILFQAGEAWIELDPGANDAISALGACADLVSYCVGPDASLDACVSRTPECATREPWTESAPCCPKACKNAYRNARNGGRDALGAFEDVFFRQPDCFPGLREELALP